MSGKPASVGASRAGVPTTPRVVVYVADPRQLEPGAAVSDLPPVAATTAPANIPPPPLDALYIPDNLHHQVNLARNTVYRTNLDRTDQRNLVPGTIFYKQLNENDKKGNVYGTSDSPNHRTDVYPVSQYVKEVGVKNEDNRSDRIGPNLKRDPSDEGSAEFNSVENFQNTLPLETLDLATYQVKCSGNSGMHQAAFGHGQSQFSENVTLHSGGDVVNCSERELSVCKSIVNYQFLEQSVSHQSIVNQSISILNQQVGVSRGIVSEGESGAPQLVRTTDGVVLAVLPTTVLPHPSDVPELSSRTVPSDPPQTITVPLGWKRIINGTSVLYVSPSGTALSTLPQLRDYLQTAGTCKCGLPCPLRPETTFSFDAKVASKPYQVASGAELTKLCNHKRKLLSTLQARSQSPATPPPQNTEQKKVMSNEVTVVKKGKIKKRQAFTNNVSVSQMMVQRERPLNEFKAHESEMNREPSTGVAHRSNNIQSLPPYASVQQQNFANIIPDSDIKQESTVQRSSHYLTVNSGWISQHTQPHLENYDAAQKQAPSSGSMSIPLSGGLPVLGTNGQIIGVNTSHSKQSNNFKNISGMALNVPEQESTKEDKTEMTTQQSIQEPKFSSKEEESQIFCGLNQALTPEVMQKINEQQQIFIQQNQKQIEMAMKGYRSQLAENIHQPPPGLTQYVPQGQLVIHNGAVVKTNPAKTPPWQVKRTESNASNPMASPSPKLQKTDNDYEEINTSISEDSSGSYSSFSSNEQVNNPGMCSRVPPLPQQYNIMGQQWPAIDTNKKKGKGNSSKANKKKNSPTESKVNNFGNNGMRLIQDSKNIDDSPTNNIPSFMDDPSGYLAQQTVLLNNTISKQVGVNSSYESNRYEHSNSINSNTSQNNFGHMDKIKSKSGEMPTIYRNNVPNPSVSPASTPDSSVLSEKGLDSAMPQCCKGCTVPMKINSPEYSENQMRLKYMKHHMYKMESDNSSTSSPKHAMIDDNPVTSSTFVERNPTVNENCGPIQAATVSTSNVSITETLPPPEPSPTLSNSSRSTDTPHSNGSNNSQMQHQNCGYQMPSPAYSNTGSCNFNSNPSTPVSNQMYPYNSPAVINNSQSMNGTQVMHFISNHNVNKNLMEVDNISMVGVKPSMKTSQDMFRLDSRRRIEHIMPGYCPPPHLGGGPAHTLVQACYVQTFVTTMASGFSVTRDTVTSVLAGKANTATTSINASQANFVRPPPPPSVNLATTYAIPNNQPDPFFNSVNLPTSYPLHIAGTTAQNMISKSPLEMVQNVIGSLPSKSESSNTQSTSLAHLNRRTCTTPGKILISSTGHILVSNNQMPPPPPKTSTAVASMQSNVTNVSTSVTQVIPAVGGMQSLVNQPTVVVNTLPGPFVIQPPMMAVDGQVMQQNTMIPQLVTSGMVPGQSPNQSPRQIDMKTSQSFVQGVGMLSPESLKKRSKKKKSPANITNVLQISAPQQNSNNIMVHHTSPQHNTSPQFSPRGFQLSPNNNISPTPMLQALTIVPGKSGTPAHIVMNGQGNTNNFGSQQIITNTSPSQQINLLQPVNLINNASSVVQNFPAFQQFIVPNLGGMVMTADGTAIIQDNSTGMPVQLQLQTVNGQNVLTPVQQNPGMFTAGSNGGVVIRAQNQQGKIIQSQQSPGAQFLSPNSQVMVNSPNFNSQLSPLLANLSPTNVSFNTPQMRSNNVQSQEYIQTNQMGQALMVPLSPKPALASVSNNRNNPTFVHQNTTIVQQQTTLVSNSHNTQMSSMTTNLQTGNPSRLSIDPNVLLANNKPLTNQKRLFGESSENAQVEEPREVRHQNAIFPGQVETEAKVDNSEGYMKFMNEFPMGGQGFSHVRHSVSTQTLVNRGKSPSGAAGGSSPPDTTTHSPLGPLESSASPRLSISTQPNYADTTTTSPEPADASSAMVQCVSSSEPDITETRDHPWPLRRNDFNSDTETQGMTPIIRQSRPHNPVESTDHYNQNMNMSVNNPQAMASNYYDRTPSYKRKSDFGDPSTYNPDKLMRTSSYNMVHGLPKQSDYDAMSMASPDKTQPRRFPPSGASSDTSTLPKVYDRHNLGSGDDTKSEDEEDEVEECGEGDACGEGEGEGAAGDRFKVGDLVWGPVKGYASWPGKLRARAHGGRWAVRWFGAERPPAALHHSRLLTLSEGLEAHHAARTNHRKSRKLNTLLENAIQEAMAELDKKSEGDGVHCEESFSESNKHDKPKTKEKHHKKNSVKRVASPTKSSDTARLRSSRT